MNFYIDKENSVLFISLNQVVNEATLQKVRDKFSEIDLPYKFIVVDNIYNVTSV